MAIRDDLWADLEAIGEEEFRRRYGYLLHVPSEEGTMVQEVKAVFAELDRRAAAAQGRAKLKTDRDRNRIAWFAVGASIAAVIVSALAFAKSAGWF